jgi:hypothetical protein
VSRGGLLAGAFFLACWLACGASFEADFAAASAYVDRCFVAGSWLLVDGELAIPSGVVASSLGGVLDPEDEGGVDQGVSTLEELVYGKGGRGEPLTWLSKCLCATVDISWQNALKIFRRWGGRLFLGLLSSCSSSKLAMLPKSSVASSARVAAAVVEASKDSERGVERVVDAVPAAGAGGSGVGKRDRGFDKHENDTRSNIYVDEKRG